MASSSGTLWQIQNCAAGVDERKRKRMQSNRESARRSRQRKQKHVDDLRAHISLISKQNNDISTTLNLRRQQYVKVEAQNSMLRAQMRDLSQRLESLNQIFLLNSNYVEEEEEQHQGFGDSLLNDNNCWNANQHPLMASPHIFDHYY